MPEFQSKADKVYELLYEKIKKRELQPGEKIVQQELAQEFDVSQTTIRDALRRLVEQGLVEKDSYKGSWVSEYSVEELLEVMETREVIEARASEKAAQRITEPQLQTLKDLINDFEAAKNADNLDKWIDTNWEFHMKITDYSGNSLFKKILSGIQDRLLASSTLGLREDLKNSVQEHKDIYLALKNHDPEASVECMKRHIRNTSERLSTNNSESGRGD